MQRMRCARSLVCRKRNNTVIFDIDIWRAANLLIKEHGVDAEIIASQRADLLLDRGDIDGVIVWKRIRRAIVELNAPPRGKPH
jgi:hypothetical protein